MRDIGYFVNIFVCISLCVWRSITAFNASKIPLPNERTAIIISGHLRSGNLTWSSPFLRRDYGAKMFGPDDPPSPIETVFKYLIDPLAEYGGVDLFIYSQMPRDESQPLTAADYQDINKELCEVYFHHDVFKPHTGNKVFCLAEHDQPQVNNLISKFPSWSTFMNLDITLEEKLIIIERYMRQLYGLYRCNLASKQHELSMNITYKYKVRLRPDNAFVIPIPKVPSLVQSFANAQGNKCNGTVYYPNWRHYAFGGEDAFNIGRSEDMNRALDRYLDAISMPFLFTSYRGQKFWNSESYLVGLMRDKYKICFESHMDIWVVLTHLGSNPNPNPKSANHRVVISNHTDWTMMT